MGGFILIDFKNEEYKYLSENTGIPIEEIPNAFECFNKLFPKREGWSFNIPNSNIIWHRFFPISLSGVGSNHRRFIHLAHLNEKDRTFEELSKLINGDRTMSDLIKWNNLGYDILNE